MNTRGEESLRSQARILWAAAWAPLCLLVLLPPGSMLQGSTIMPPLDYPDYVVTERDLHRELTAAEAIREYNLAVIEEFFTQDAARKALARARVDTPDLRHAMKFLTDHELEKLAEQARHLQSTMSQPQRSKQQYVYFSMATAAAVVALLLR
jgi:hypothetical protein